MGVSSVAELVNQGVSLEAPKADAGRLRSYFDRIVRLEKERRELGDAIKDVYTEVKAAGLNPAALKRNVKRALENDKQRAKRERTEEDAEVMRAALGEFSSSPLGQAAIRAVT